MSQPILPEVIETKRLLLRPWRFEDVEDAFRYAADEEWGRFQPLPHPYTRPDAVEFVARQILLDRTAHPSWAIVLGGVVIGGINIRFNFPRRSGGMGWAIARSTWGQGLATEAAAAVIAAAFAAHANLNRIEAVACALNTASLRVMEKVGLKREGTSRQSIVLKGVPHDESWFGILRSEWAEITAK